MSEEEAYKNHVDFIEKETGLSRHIIEKVLQADEKYLEIVIAMMEGVENELCKK